MSSPNCSPPRPKKLKGLALASPSSSTPRPEENKAPMVAMEKVKEKAKLNPYPKLRSPPEVMSLRRIENPSFGSSVAQSSGDILKLYPPASDQIFTCSFCKQEFRTYQALGGHQNGHKREREQQKKRKEMEAEFPLPFLNPYTDNPHILLGGYSNDSFSNANHSGITLNPFERLIYPSFNSGFIGGSTCMNMTSVPRVSPTCFFTRNTSTNLGSSSRVPNPLPNNISPFSFFERNVFPSFSGTTELSGSMVSQENALREENFISKIGTDNVVVIDDNVDDDSDIDLSLSL